MVRSEFQAPVLRKNETFYKYAIAGVCSPFVLALLALLFLTCKAYYFFYFLGTGTLICIPVHKFSVRRIKEEKNAFAAKEAEIELDRQLFYSKKGTAIQEVQGQIKVMRKSLNLLSKQINVSFLAPEYQTDGALHFILDQMSGSRNLSLHEALYSYDRQRQYEEERKQKIQMEQEKIRIEQARQQAELQLQKEQLKAEKEARAEKKRQERLEREQEQLKLELELERTQRMREKLISSRPQQIIQQVHITTPAPVQPRVPVNPNGKPLSTSAPASCPVCGHTWGWNKIDEQKEGYNVGAAVVGCLFLGPLGLLAGAAGNKT